MAEEGEWKKSIEEALLDLSGTLQKLQVQQQQQQLPLPQPQEADEDRSLEIRKQPQPFRRKDDPNTYLTHFEAIASFNRWDTAQCARAFPTYLHAAALQWYATLDHNTKSNFRLLKEAFINCYQGANDRQRLEQDFAYAKFADFDDLDEYADRLEDLGARLGKTNEEVIKKFVVGLADAVYRWVNNSLVTDLGDAMELANQGLILFPHKTGRTAPFQTTRRPEQQHLRPRFNAPSSYRQEERRQPHRPEERREEPMEFRQRFYGRSHQTGQQFQQNQRGRDPRCWSNPAYRQTKNQ